jgi:hypothetical protein
MVPAASTRRFPTGPTGLPSTIGAVPFAVRAMRPSCRATTSSPSSRPRAPSQALRPQVQRVAHTSPHRILATSHRACCFRPRD